jgi:predicted nucleic acid-binding Zn ribbon protein
MDNLIKTLPAILAATRASPEVAEAACISAWKHAVGDLLATRAIPLQLHGKTLAIIVQDSIWQKQLEQMRGHLLFRLNAVLGQALVDSLEFRVDAERFRKAEQPTEEADNNSRSAAIPIELLSAAASIEDAGLRRSFLGAAVSCIKRNENLKSD